MINILLCAESTLRREIWENDLSPGTDCEPPFLSRWFLRCFFLFIVLCLRIPHLTIQSVFTDQHLVVSLLHNPAIAKYDDIL